MTAYHLHRGSKPVDATRASARPAAVLAFAGSRSLRWGMRPQTCGTTPAPCRDPKWEVDSKAEVNGS